MDSPTDCGWSSFELKPPVWEMIAELCPEKEASEVKRLLGLSLVEQSRDLYDEAKALLEIWRQFREHTPVVSIPPRLPEPPAVRERLIQEVRFFTNHLQKRTSGRCVPVLSAKDKGIVDYVMNARESKGRSSRPASAVSSTDGRETPLRYTPSSEEGSQSSLSTERLGTVADKVNVMDIDTVTSHLRQVIEDECVERREDITFLQSCLEEEQDHVSEPEPTIQELRKFGTHLEREILQEASFTILPLTPTVPRSLSPKRPELKPAVEVGVSRRRQLWPIPTMTSDSQGLARNH